MKIKKNPKRHVPTKYYLVGVAALCAIGIFAGLALNLSGGPLNAVAGYVMIPMQRGINYVGLWVSQQTDNLQSLRATMDENQRLQDQVDRLSQDLNVMRLDQAEFDRLRELFQLSERYSDYNKVGARVIGKNGGNWFSLFIIDKGIDDGIEVDMNVIAGSGLVGLVTDVGPNFAKVRSIIDDNSNVSAMTQSGLDRCIVSGNLQTMNEQRVIQFSGLRIGNPVAIGDFIVTSNVSEKFLEGLLIGQIHSFQPDSNNLTYSGTIAPAVNFDHLQEVLVILDKKVHINPEDPIPDPVDPDLDPEGGEG